MTPILNSRREWLGNAKEIIMNHVYVTNNGISVIVLNTGAKITAEDAAMLMALHSRSPAGILSHLKKLENTGSGDIMSRFYVGYGHKSIGDCGNTYIFIEGISMLAVKAIQDSQLYNGQECSTRYIDFSTQLFTDPINSEETARLHKTLREFYTISFPLLVNHIKNINPRDGEEGEDVYNKAINARAFDILRGFLPAGASTNVAWNTNLRQAGDRLLYLRNHPLIEVRENAQLLQQALSQAHPNSFGHKQYQSNEKYVSEWMGGEQYLHSDNSMLDNAYLRHNGVDLLELENYRRVLESRPAKTELPKAIGICGNLRFNFNLDFGSYRDIQRQRAVVMRMPFLSIRPGFENWYMSQLPDNLKTRAKQVLSEVEAYVSNLSKEYEFTSQYYVPMGYKVPVDFSGDLPGIVYLTELRATRFVHTTLQIKAIQIADILEETFGRFGLKIHIDRNDVGRFNVKRGHQDIVLK